MFRAWINTAKIAEVRGGAARGARIGMQRPIDSSHGMRTVGPFVAGLASAHGNRASEPADARALGRWEVGAPAARRPHLHRDWAHPCHICAGTGLAPSHICTGPGSPRHICTGTGLTPPTSHTAPGLRRVSDGTQPLLRRDSARPRRLPCPPAHPAVSSKMQQQQRASCAQPAPRIHHAARRIPSGGPAPCCAVPCTGTTRVGALRVRSCAGRVRPNAPVPTDHDDRRR
jgi:hypothetical protein